MDCIDLIVSFTQTFLGQTKCDVLDSIHPFYFCVLGFLVDVKIWTEILTLTIKCMIWSTSTNLKFFSRKCGKDLIWDLGNILIFKKIFDNYVNRYFSIFFDKISFQH